jgi:hypothetical protein
VASSNTENLRRVLIARLGEGENIPHKAVQAEDLFYIPQFIVQTTVQVAKPGQRTARPLASPEPAAGFLIFESSKIKTIETFSFPKSTLEKFLAAICSNCICGTLVPQIS